VTTLEELLDKIAEAFRPSAPIHDGALLTGRATQLLDLQGMSRAAGAHAVIFGERGVGKSSVSRVFLQYLEGRGIKSALINCVADSTFENLWTEMFDAWAEREEEVLNFDLAEALRLAGSGISPQSLVRALLAQSRETSVVLVFDEFDQIADAGVTEKFANLMKALSDQESRAHVVVVGVGDDVVDLLSGHRSVKRALKQVKLPRLKEQELHDLLERGFNTVGIVLPDRLAKRIARVSTGLPYYAHALGHACATQAAVNERGEVTEDDWIRALGSTISSTEHDVNEAYIEATAMQEGGRYAQVLLACALLDCDEFGYFSSEQVSESLTGMDAEGSDVNADSELWHLSQSDRGPALEDRTFADGSTRYRFCEPLLQPFLIVRALDADQIEPNVVWNESAS
jgi:Cdc6-like AAA superfamily ATPase